MLKNILGALGVGIVVIAVCTGLVVFYVKGGWATTPDRYPEGTCLKMVLPGVESWQGGLPAQVVTVGKQNYEVKYWTEYGWSNLTGTWPFSLDVAKVGCPMEVQDKDDK